MKRIWNGIAGFVFGLTVLLAVPAVNVAAAEFTVTPAEAVLYTNENTVILADADDSTIVLSEVAADLPIQVTGRLRSMDRRFIFMGLDLVRQRQSKRQNARSMRLLWRRRLSFQRECTGQMTTTMAGRVGPTLAVMAVQVLRLQ